MNPKPVLISSAEERPIGLADLLRDPALAEGLPVEAIPAILGELEALKAQLAGRYYAALAAAAIGHKDGGEDQLLTAEEAAGKLGTTVYYLYRHSKKLPFTVKLSPRQLRLSSKGIEKYKQQRQLG